MPTALIAEDEPLLKRQLRDGFSQASPFPSPEMIHYHLMITHLRPQKIVPAAPRPKYFQEFPWLTVQLSTVDGRRAGARQVPELFLVCSRLGVRRGPQSGRAGSVNLRERRTP